MSVVCEGKKEINQNVNSGSADSWLVNLFFLFCFSIVSKCSEKKRLTEYVGDVTTKPTGAVPLLNSGSEPGSGWGPTARPLLSWLLWVFRKLLYQTLATNFSFETRHWGTRWARNVADWGKNQRVWHRAARVAGAHGAWGILQTVSPPGLGETREMKRSWSHSQRMPFSIPFLRHWPGIFPISREIIEEREIERQLNHPSHLPFLSHGQPAILVLLEGIPQGLPTPGLPLHCL